MVDVNYIENKNEKRLIKGADPLQLEAMMRVGAELEKCTLQHTHYAYPATSKGELYLLALLITGSHIVAIGLCSGMRTTGKRSAKRTMTPKQQNKMDGGDR
jgi:hypothetical protein